MIRAKWMNTINPISSLSNRGNIKALQGLQGHIPAMLPHYQPAASQVGHVVHRWLKPRLEKDPSYVCMPETLLNVVGIVIMVNMLVMATMVGAPDEGRVLHGCRPEQKRGQLNRPFCTERKV